MEDLSSEWRVVDEAEAHSSSGCPFLRAQSYLTSSSGAASPALTACPHPRTSSKGGVSSSRCPFMRLLFLFLSMLPSASALSTEAALVLPKGAPTTRLSASRPSLAARVPSVCGRDCRRHAPATMRRDDSLIRQSTGLGLGPDGGGGSGGKVLILGAGWMGSRVAAALRKQGEEVEVTHRPRTDLDAKDPYFRPIELPASVPRHEFDLLSPDSWANLPAPETLAAVVVTFPVSLPTAAQFWETYLCDVPTVICYSSTSVYQIDVPGKLLTPPTAPPPFPQHTPSPPPPHLAFTPRPLCYTWLTAAILYLQASGWTSRRRCATLPALWPSPSCSSGVPRCSPSQASSPRRQRRAASARACAATWAVRARRTP